MCTDNWNQNQQKKKSTCFFFSALIVHVTTPKMCLYLEDYGLMELPQQEKQRNKQKIKEKTKNFNTLLS